MTDRKRAQLLRGKRVGLLLAGVHSGSSLQLWPPVAVAAEKMGVELFIFPGGRLSAGDRGEAIRNRIFDLADARNLDGIVSWASSLGGFVGPSELDSFHARFGSLPLVAMAHHLPGRPAVRIDAYAGMFPLLRHLHDAHGIRRFAYIRGPAEHESASDRFRAFHDFHAERGIPLEPRLIASPRPWNEGRAAIEELLDERALMPGRDFDALLAASDLQLYDAVRVLQSRGFSVPKDLLVAGFNDSEESRILSPTVTTVRMPFREQAERAFSALLSLLANEPVPSDQTLGTELVIRRSCACLSASVRDAGFVSEDGEYPALPKIVSAEELHGDFAATLRSSLIEAACSGIGSGADERSAWMEPMVDDFLVALGQDFEVVSTSPFLLTLERIAERLIGLERDVELWQDVLSSMRRVALSRLGMELGRRAESLIDRARVVVSEASGRAHAYRVWKAGRFAQAIRELEKDLIRVEERANLGSVLAARLPSLNIDEAYLIEEIGGGRAKLIAGFDLNGTLDPAPLRDFPADELMHPQLVRSRPGLVWIVEPLSGNDEYFGRLILRLGVPDGTIYEELRSAVSSSLQGLRSIDAIRRARAAAEKAEALKTRFLANISAELRSPLRSILESASRAESALSPKTRGRSFGRIGAELRSIQADARRQLRLTDDLLDLSRSEVGELDLELVLLRPEAALAKALEDISVATSRLQDSKVLATPIEMSGVSHNSLPFILGDETRLARLLALLIERARPASVSFSFESCAIECSILRTDGEPVQSDDGFGRGVALARRLAAAHSGLLEQQERSGHIVGWTLRLPFPNLDGTALALDDSKGEIVFLSSSGQIPSTLSNCAKRSSSLVVVDPADILAGTSSVENAVALAWDRALATASEAAAVFSLSRYERFSHLPFLFFSSLSDDSTDAAVSVTYSSVADAVFAAAGDAGRGAVLVYDPFPNRRLSLISLIASASIAEVSGTDSPEGIRAFRSRFGARSLVISRSIDPTFLSVIKNMAMDRPPLLVLCDRLASEDDISPIATESRVVLLNEGVLDARELAELIHELLDGRSILSPYTGSVVKHAILYLNQHLATPITRWKLAEAVHVSEDYLTRIFRKELGLSPWDYLSRLRVREARHLLLETPESVRAVAALTGFPDQAYFCRVFRKVVGCSPSAYRDSAVL